MVLSERNVQSPLSLRLRTGTASLVLLSIGQSKPWANSDGRGGNLDSIPYGKNEPHHHVTVGIDRKNEGLGNCL